MKKSINETTIGSFLYVDPELYRKLLIEIINFYIDNKPQTMTEQMKHGWYIQACRDALKEIT
tara:strand:- start:1440 stop:1625 length:186 start_codon:yes stop_codon:yes gene_type:complete